MVKSAERVLDVLEMLSLESVPGLRLTDIADRLGIPKSSAVGLMKTLEQRCYATRAGDGRYVLNPMLAGGGWIGGLQARLLSVARPLMAKLVEQTGETAFIGVLSEDQQVRLLHKALSPNAVRYDTDDRQLRPAYCTSIGRVQLAYLPPHEIESYLAQTKLERFTANTLTTPEALLADLASIRAQGYAESVDSREIGASGVSAPIPGPAGEVIAGLNLSAVTQRFLSQQDMMRSAVQAAATAISREFCGFAGTSGSSGLAGAERHRRLAGAATGPGIEATAL